MSLPAGAIPDDEEPQQWHADPLPADASEEGEGVAVEAEAGEDEAEDVDEEEEDEAMLDEDGEAPWQGASGGAADYAARYMASMEAKEEPAADAGEGAELLQEDEVEDGEEQPLPAAEDLSAAFFSEMAASQSYKKRRGNGVAADDDAESDEEYGVVQSRAFAIPQRVIRSFDPASTEPPATAEEYLLRVRMEAEACPRVKVSSIDPRAFAHRQTRYVPDLGLVPRPANPACLPTEQWQTDYAADFAQARQQLLCYTANNAAQLRKQPLPQGIPGKRDFFGWMTYCVGNIAQQMADAAALSAAAAGQSSAATPAAAAPAAAGSAAFMPHLPSLSIVVGMDQVQTKGVLTQLMQLGVDTVQRRKYHAGRALSTGQPLPPFPFPTHAYTLWLFTLMLKVDKPLVSAVSSGMRALYRSLCWLRAHHNTPASAEVKHANMLLTLLDRAFGQAVQSSDQQAQEKQQMQQQYMQSHATMGKATAAPAAAASAPLLPYPASAPLLPLSAAVPLLPHP